MSELMVNGVYTLTEMGLVKEFIGSTVVMSVGDNEMEVVVNDVLLAEIKELHEENNILLLPVDLISKSIIIDAELV